ncbi:acyltransferase [Pseudoluteimonas lycopersici]|uniref:Acyltransferase n=1 Tax=Pseudoluteimonas lycopersici TaxID=1324796 RepID=A0A516V517_9GAMM|nr:acyltransferase [Lysobacter lycopersici]QDQ73625.1 acyltransferase [Lysobacter lycopersici]
MKSTSGIRYIALDHVRALAAFLVFSWHFLRFGMGHPPVPDDAVPLFPFALLDEGHTGVALFMALSGYLFAKLLDGKSVDYRAFFWNRALRLLPLLLFVVAIVGVLKHASGANLHEYALSVAKGVLWPTLPNGGWSITVEAHFYLLLPLLVLAMGKSRWWLPGIVAVAIALRAFLHHANGEVQSLAYFTLVGRIDQFALGMLAWQLRSCFAKRHALALLMATAFMLFYWYFDMKGGFRHMPSYPSPSALWIVLPTIEAVAYAVCIAWYDNSFSPGTTGVSGFVGRIGEYSYSIYLLHVFFTGRIGRWMYEHGVPIPNFYVACAWSLLFFLLMAIPAYLSYRFVESPFLRLRKRYLRVAPAVQ